MTQRILTTHIGSELDVVGARQRARQIAALCGFGVQDQVRIATAVSELARNVYNYAGSGKVHFAIDGQTAPQLFSIRIEDQGPGIDEGERERLFERFYSRGNVHGAGLGLTIVSVIARHLGGQINLDNLPQGGLRATLSIPCNQRPRLSSAWMPHREQ